LLSARTSGVRCFEETLVSLKRTQKQLPKPEPGRDQELELPIYASSRAAADGAGNFQLRSLAAGQYSFNLRVSAKYWYLRSVTLPGTAKDAITVDVARNLLTTKIRRIVSAD
jgi:hypothetical protein